MPKKKSERIKLYLFIGLTVIFVISGYFRFIHKKTKSAPDQAVTAKPLARVDVPQTEISRPETTKGFAWPEKGSLRTDIRDIFTLQALPPWADNSSGEHKIRRTGQSLAKKSTKPPLVLKLCGMIVGGRKPVAIINDQFLRKGERIGDYRVIWISKNAVMLDSGKEKIELEMGNHE